MTSRRCGSYPGEGRSWGESAGAISDKGMLHDAEPFETPLTWRRGTVSLLDMLPFFAKSFMRKLVEQSRAKEPSVGSIATHLQQIGQILGQAGMTSFQDRGDRVFRSWKEERLTLEIALYELRSFHEDLVPELGRHLYFVIPSSDRHFYDDLPLTSAAVDGFSSAAEELAESGKCIALDRWIASVYHSMRALEIGLKAIADRLGVTYDRDTWGRLLGEIEKAIPVYRRDHPDDPISDLCAEAAIHFRLLKDAWRDHTMHARKLYSPTKAKEILDHTIGVIEDLAAGGLEERR